MKHITIEYYHAGTPYLLPEAIEEIIQSQGTVKNACREMANRYSTSTRRIYKIWKRHAKDRKSKKRKPGSSSRSVQVSDSVNIIRTKTSFSANKVGITDILIKKVDEMDDLQVKLAQNCKEREEAKHEMKRILDFN
ncbi:1037_t:CDS:2 [Ambispora leptoticha]|uniref:1037_t:CDS:1 n=1 Tax=Ambispora leptoticha TaxID=144679 RepID=A0A9N9AHE9_9GLOM|nr:1037_t:CDS:2 [Ambispora leptoticha]